MKEKILQLLINLRFAICLLIVIAFLSGIGSIIEQDQTLEYYRQNYPLEKPFFGFFSYIWIFSLQLNHIYTSWLFLFLIFILGLSLILCTFKQQLPLLETSRRYFFIEDSFTLPIQKKIRKRKRISENSILFLQKKNFYVHQQKNFLYGFKGILGKIGPIFVHCSLVCILIGGILGAFGRFQAQEFLPKGEILHVQNLSSTALFSFFPNFSIRMNDFWIEYKNQKINQFYSDLSLLDNLGKEMVHQTVNVNLPLQYNKINFYQTDWNILGIRLENTNQQIYQYPLTLIRKTPKIWSSWIFLSDFKSGVFLFVDDLRQSVKIYNSVGTFIDSLNFGDKLILSGEEYKIIDLIPETGLQIKYDPSISLTFLGFGFLILSTFLSYLTYSQIWISLKRDIVFFGGKTTRAKSSFEVECRKFVDSEKILSS
jgi:cytochrome c biogenesis protein